MRQGIDNQKAYVQWVVNDQKTFHRSLLPLLEIYPPLTTRIRLQYQFFRRFLHDQLPPSKVLVEKYLRERGCKYEEREKIIPLFTSTPNYFSDWLAGFIESEGSFSNRKAGNSSFSIAQNFDAYLVEAIRDFYGQNHLKVSKKMKSGLPLYELSVASVKGLNQVISHCAPLLQGYKYYQLVEFVFFLSEKKKSKGFQSWSERFIN